jgi:hypothetical protein
MKTEIEAKIMLHDNETKVSIKKAGINKYEISIEDVESFACIYFDDVELVALRDALSRMLGGA